MKKKVLIITGNYIPSVKAGGPVRSIKNIIDNLSKEIDFYIITSDRDLGDKRPFNNIKIDEWTQVETANVYYTDPSKLSVSKFSKVIKSVEYDVMYLNSFFSFKFSILPLILRKFKRINNKPAVLIPRGELNKGALRLKKFKKELYIRLSKIFKLYNDVKWHATNEIEKLDIQQVFGQDINVKIAGNLTADYNNREFDKTILKKPGELKIVFISRIHPKKNLLQALEVLKKLNGKITFNIHGPIEDKKYWNSCKNIINEMPENVKVEYHGTLRNEEVNNTYKRNHVFLFLTLGENFGHVISEALIGGCPVIISDQTPWRKLEYKRVGYDLPLKNNSLITEKIQYYVELNNKEYRQQAKKSFNYGKSESNQSEDISEYIKMFSFK